MTKIKIFASDDLEKLVSDLNEFIEEEVDDIVDTDKFDANNSSLSSHELNW